MSSSFLILFLLIVSTTNLTLSFPIFSSKVTSKQLNEICSKAKIPSACFDAFNSNPQTSKTDLKGLCKISIDLARAHATDTLSAFGSLAKFIRDPTIKSQYATCCDYYDEAIGALLQAAQSLAAGDYRAVRAAAIIVENEAADCAKKIGRATYEIRRRNENMEELGSVVESVAAYVLRV